MKKAFFFSTGEVVRQLSEAFSTDIVLNNTEDYDSAPFRICGVSDTEGDAFVVANTGGMRRGNCFCEDGAVLCNGFVLGLYLARKLGYEKCSYGDVQLSKALDMDGYTLVFLNENISTMPSRWLDVNEILPEQFEDCERLDDGRMILITVLAMDESGTIELRNRMFVRTSGIEYLDRNFLRDEWFWSQGNIAPVKWLPIPRVNNDTERNENDNV